MPVLSWAHSQYWSGATAGPPPPEIGGGSAGGYIPFQAAIASNVFAGSGLGSLQAAYEWLMARRKPTARKGR